MSQAEPDRTLPRTADIVIIGGGVMGASNAYHLARETRAKIVLLERLPFFGHGATGKCAGGVRHQFATEVNIRLSIESLSMLDRFEEETGQRVDYQKCGYLFALTREADVSTFRKNVELQRGLGVMTEWLTRDEVHSRLPLMRLEDALAGTFYDQDGLVDPNGVVMGYIDRARDLGVTTLAGVEVTGISVHGSRVSGVETADGKIDCPVVVNAAGPWAGLVGRMAGVDLPIQPVRRQMLTTTPLPSLPRDFPFVIDFAQSLYFHPEGEGLLTGMSNPDEPPGFDEQVDEAWELKAMEAAIRRLPLLEQAGRLSHWAGLYEVTPDAHPILGETPVEGSYVCAGFSGHGLMHGPIVGKLMSEIILTGRASTVDVSMLDYWRFKEGRLVQEYNVI